MPIKAINISPLIEIFPAKVQIKGTCDSGDESSSKAQVTEWVQQAGLMLLPSGGATRPGLFSVYVSCDVAPESTSSSLPNPSEDKIRETIRHLLERLASIARSHGSEVIPSVTHS